MRRPKFNPPLSPDAYWMTLGLLSQPSLLCRVAGTIKGGGEETRYTPLSSSEERQVHRQREEIHLEAHWGRELPFSCALLDRQQAAPCATPIEMREVARELHVSKLVILPPPQKK